jgi:hypothetical protein
VAAAFVQMGTNHVVRRCCCRTKLISGDSLKTARIGSGRPLTSRITNDTDDAGADYSIRTAAMPSKDGAHIYDHENDEQNMWKIESRAPVLKDN